MSIVPDSYPKYMMISYPIIKAVSVGGRDHPEHRHIRFVYSDDSTYEDFNEQFPHYKRDVIRHIVFLCNDDKTFRRADGEEFRPADYIRQGYMEWRDALRRKAVKQKEKTQEAS